MKKFLLATASAVLLLSGATAASAQVTAQPFLRLDNERRQDMNVVAKLVEESLAKDATGNLPVSAAECASSGSCITPREIHESIRLKHPDVQVGPLANLPRYMRALVKNQSPKPGVRTVGRVLVEGQRRTLDWGMQRELFPDEVTWNDPNTGEEVFAGNCLNVIDLNFVDEVVVTPPSCIEAVVPVTVHGHATRTAIFEDGEIPQASIKRCLAYKRVGQTNWTEGWVEECRWGEIPLNDGRVTTCSMEAVVAAVQLRVERQGGFNLQKQAGYIVVRLPPEIAGFWVCHEEHEHKDGFQHAEIRHYYGQLARQDDFVAESDGVRRARFPSPKLSSTSAAFSYQTATP